MRLVACAFAVTGAGCSATQSVLDDDMRFARVRHELTVVRSTNVILNTDEDADEPDGGVELEADLEDADGFGLEYDYGDGRFGTKLAVHYSEHDTEQGGGAELTHFQYSIYTGERYGSAPVIVNPQFGAGAGVLTVDLDDPVLADRGGLTGSVFGALGFEIGRHARLRAGAEFFVWGYPSETFGTGRRIYVSLGAAF